MRACPRLAAGPLARWFAAEHAGIDAARRDLTEASTGLPRITQLTFNTADDQGPTWSADGTKIGFNSNSTGVYQIYTVSPAGGAPIALTAGVGGNFTPSWSPNGAKIAFTSTRDVHNEIYVMNPDGTGQTRLTGDDEWDYDATWSPDGSKITYTHGGGIPDIFAMNADG